MSELPVQPGQRILRSEAASQWIDGYAFLQAAREQAQAIQADTRQIEETARAAGFERGREEGLEEAARLIAATAGNVDAYLAGLESGLADLALGIVLQVLGELDRAERIALATQRALSAFRERQALTLHVAPGQVEALRLQLGPVLCERVTVSADDTLTNEQARLSSPVASVELTMEAQLRVLREALLPQSMEPAP